MFTKNDRLEINSQWGKPDVNQGIHIFEYNRKFDRVDFTLKLSQYENSISLLATAYRNFFVGMEAIQVNFNFNFQFFKGNFIILKKLYHMKKFNKTK